ncbi:DNA endonuclease III [Sulfolobus sp. A20]|uniref:endonuclease III domain-containing protein n=1 Tax=Sulfolobaceae TaxID=118883 RepID=UPI000845D4BF|nr:MULTISPECIES: DNA endonuclease III [unclassified Sulfolobus]TRM73431.1 DNA endonuclease III [Sulfolobus sp. E5]TRM77877.1 DNA endonuclease III [Sulfolobus sp. A20-N-F8]TRM80873.1 DNA endonuclease III [Sulfolobus sp. D5]TRM88758.1 DNA endonuclease III [Sulfolobus sp. E3]TRN02180.1 DNA endonuclease III [Sulfolobus sp. E1]
MRESFELMLDIFLKEKELLRKKGWIVSSPYSYEWWDGLKSAEEIIISAILVQMSRWENVKRVIQSMREVGLTNFEKLYMTSDEELYSLFKSINFYRTKVKRLKYLAKITIDLGSLEKLYDRDILLSIDGVGEETADSILLFAGHKLHFPPSEYGKRVLSRLFGRELNNKREVKTMVENNLRKGIFEYKLFHAGIVTVGRAFCFKEPKCDNCILKDICNYAMK